MFFSSFFSSLKNRFIRKKLVECALDKVIDEEAEKCWYMERLNQVFALGNKICYGEKNRVIAEDETAASLVKSSRVISEENPGLPDVKYRIENLSPVKAYERYYYYSTVTDLLAFFHHYDDQGDVLKKKFEELERNDRMKIDNYILKRIS